MLILVILVLICVIFKISIKIVKYVRNRHAESSSETDTVPSVWKSCAVQISSDRSVIDSGQSTDLGDFIVFRYA